MLTMNAAKEIEVDYTYMAKSCLSMLFFAPGVFVLATCIFIGLLLLAEKALASPD